MSQATLAIAGSVSMLTGLAFAAVARAVSTRGATGHRLLARRAHTTWWGALAVYLVVQGSLTLLASAGALDLTLYLATRALLIPLLCAGTWGITFYLVYLYTGRVHAAKPLAIVYGLVALAFFYATYGTTQSVTVGQWVVSLDDTSPLYRAIYALIGIPPIVASAAYLGLLRRTPSPAQRYRITLVAGSILGYVASGLAARFSQNDVLIFVTLVLFGLGAALASLAAYYPPRAVRERLGPEVAP